MYTSFSDEKIKIPVNQYLVETGDRFDKLTVNQNPYWRLKKKLKHGKPQKYQFVECSCECGNIRVCEVRSLKNGDIKSCKECAKKSFLDKMQKCSYAVNGTKVCSVCQTQLKTENFWKDKNTKDGFQISCKSCKYKRVTNKKFNQDISFLLKKKLHCEICNKQLFLPNEAKSLNETLRIDHNHKTGKIRGILCHNCNMILGHCKDSKEILSNSLGYLDKYS